MSDDLEIQLPTWAPRLRKTQIARLYETCGRGMLDKELIDDVGFSLLARAESILTASRARGGQAPCPRCKTSVEYIGSGADMRLQCDACGWKCPWQAYAKTFKYKGLFAGGMQPFLEEFAQKFPKAKLPAERLILIDTLIHRYHWQASSGTGRPGASGLIEGKISNIMPFLDSLSYGEKIPPEIEATREEWREQWRKNPWKARTEKMAARNKTPKPSGN